MKILLSALVLYGIYCLALFLFQRQMMFPRYLLGSGAGAVPEGVVSEWIELSDGRVETWYLPPPGAKTPAPAAVVAHGNGELIDDLPDEFAPLQRMGLGVLMVEYPGYGRSDGAPSQKRIAEVFARAYDRLVDRPEIDPERIVFFGRSLGGGAVCDLTRRRSARALVLVSTFTSARSFARRYLAPGFLVRDPFDNADALKRFSGPVLVVHGRQDEVVGFAHGEALAGAAPRAKLLALNCGHNDCPPDPYRFWGEIERFFLEAGVLNVEG
jgi:pimeloyl-ACP methyl ester carboxylesterase